MYRIIVLHQFECDGCQRCSDTASSERLLRERALADGEWLELRDEADETRSKHYCPSCRESLARSPGRTGKNVLEEIFSTIIDHRKRDHGE